MNKPKRMAALSLALLLGLAGLVEPVVAQGNAPVEAPVADLSEAGKAQQALEEFIRAYETGNIGLIRSKLDPGMIGYQRFIDGMIQDSNRLKQIRLHLLDTQTTAGPDVVVIQTSWEKRFLSATALTPDINSGRSQFLLHRGKDGWRVAAVGGDNPFSSQSGVLAQLSLTQTGPTRVNAVVVDPDMAGKGMLEVHVNAVTRQLFETTPGRFAAGPMEVGRGIVTLKYMDANPGGGRPPSLLTRSITIQ